MYTIAERNGQILFVNRFQMDYFACNIYSLMEDDRNVIYITSLIENRSSFGFYLSMSMLWKSMYRCVGEEKEIFRLYPVSVLHIYSYWFMLTLKFYAFQPSNLIDITKKISLKRLDTEFDTVFTFILLHSKIASLIFHRKLRAPHYKCYEEFFQFDASLIKILIDFLENTLMNSESMWRRNNENLDYLTVRNWIGTLCLKVKF